MKWSEGRVSFFGKESKAGQRRLERRAAANNAGIQTSGSVLRNNDMTAVNDDGIDEEIPKGSPGFEEGRKVVSNEVGLDVVEREIEVSR